MNNKIKNKLQKLINLSKYIVEISKKDVNDIKDYIDGLIYCLNNLQKENEKLRDKLIELHKKINELERKDDDLSIK